MNFCSTAALALCLAAISGIVNAASPEVATAPVYDKALAERLGADERGCVPTCW